MKEISLHILDIIQNSIAAEADKITVSIEEMTDRDSLSIEIADNGKGMDPETLARASDPFMTTRKTRKVGLGLSMFKAGVEACNGHFAVRSQIGMGTRVSAVYQLSHIDRPPLGNMTETLLTVVLCNPDIDFEYNHRVGKAAFSFSTQEVKERLGDVPLSYPDVIEWLEGYLNEGINSLNGGA